MTRLIIMIIIITLSENIHSQSLQSQAKYKIEKEIKEYSGDPASYQYISMTSQDGTIVDSTYEELEELYKQLEGAKEATYYWYRKIKEIEHEINNEIRPKNWEENKYCELLYKSDDLILSRYCELKNEENYISNKIDSINSTPYKGLRLEYHVLYRIRNKYNGYERHVNYIEYDPYVKKWGYVKTLH